MRIWPTPSSIEASMVRVGAIAGVRKVAEAVLSRGVEADGHVDGVVG